MILVEPFFDSNTSTFSYVAYDPASKDAVVIDPVLDFDPLSATISFKSLDRVADFIAKNRLTVHLVTDTHVHADHMSGAHFLKKRLGVKSAIGSGFFKAQSHFCKLYDIDPTNYDQAYDIYLADGQHLDLGTLELTTISSPGHTPTCSCYLIDDALFVGDAIFQPELGCGRTDFPGGSAHDLYQSITKHIFDLPDETRIFVGHDYPKDNEDPAPKTSVLEEKRHNILLAQSTKKEDFIAIRNQRDQHLALPRLMLFVMQVNALGGQLPYVDAKGQHFLRVPLTIET